VRHGGLRHDLWFNSWFNAHECPSRPISCVLRRPAFSARGPPSPSKGTDVLLRSLDTVLRAARRLRSDPTG
jgi:hypothetical protein